MKQLKTSGDLRTAREKPGFLLLKRRPLGKSCIHTLACGSIQLLSIGEDRQLGRGKARQEYYHCETWEEAVEGWAELVSKHNKPKPCGKCRPSPEGTA